MQYIKKAVNKRNERGKNQFQDIVRETTLSETHSKINRLVIALKRKQNCETQFNRSAKPRKVLSMCVL